DQKHVHPGYISPRSVEARHQTGHYGIKAADKDNRNGRGRGLGGKCGWRCKRGDHRCVAPDQIGSHGRQPIELSLRPTIFDCAVAAVLIPLFAQPSPKRCDHRHECTARSAIEKADYWHRRLLRARRERPRDRRAADERDELAPLHSITSSAATSSLSGTVRPSIRAVEVLTTNSNFVDCATGRSAGLTPLRIRPVEAPTCRHQ